jgi:hypothetical protein
MGRNWCLRSSLIWSRDMAALTLFLSFIDGDLLHKYYMIVSLLFILSTRCGTLFGKFTQNYRKVKNEYKPSKQRCSEKKQLK